MHPNHLVPPPPKIEGPLKGQVERDPALLKAMREVPRERFLSRSSNTADVHHGELHLPIPEGQTMCTPEIVCTLVEALGLTPASRVLQVGAGSGYSAAVMSHLAAEVYTVERLAPLADLVRRRMETLGFSNVYVRHGDGLDGWPKHAPFDAILVSASGTEVPRRLLEQLAVGGSLVMPVGPFRIRQTVIRVTRIAESEFREEKLGEIRFVTRLGDILVEMGVADRADVEKGAEQTVVTGQKIGEALLETSKIEEADVYRALAFQRGLKFGRVDDLLQQVDPAVVRSVSRVFLERNRVIPLAQLDGTLMVATSDPNASVSDLLGVFRARSLAVYLVTPTDYRRLWSALDLRHGNQITTEIEGLGEAQGRDLLAQDSGTIEAHAVALFETMLLDAIGERASDIHLERYGDRVRVRLRVDGELRDLNRFRLGQADFLGLVNVIKIRANLNIAERRLPQGGRVRLRAGAHLFDLRVQTQPSLHGEHVVIRILPQNTNLLTIEDLGYPKAIAEPYRRLLSSPAGLVLVVGPTGSGKTTTMYAGLQILAHESTRKVITIEDPIEYTIDSVQQVQVRPEIGFGFADAMRSFVRQDPDVILVGEIRDAETALEAIRASETGHVVLSALHCNDATDAVQRLYDLGMHPNSVTSELLAVIAQRLAKRICEGCRVEVQPEPEILGELFPDGPPPGFACYRGRGCSRCEGHGTHGRIAVVEFLRVGPAVRRAICRHPPADELRETALGAGLVTMRASALDLVTNGTIALSELPRILPAERMAPEGRPAAA